MEQKRQSKLRPWMMLSKILMTLKETILPSGAGLELLKNVKNNNLIGK